jgi:hypothetical protein
MLIWGAGETGVAAATREFLAERHSEALEIALWVRELCPQPSRT